MSDFHTKKKEQFVTGIKSGGVCERECLGLSSGDDPLPHLYEALTGGHFFFGHLWEGYSRKVDEEEWMTF